MSDDQRPTEVPGGRKSAWDAPVILIIDDEAPIRRFLRISLTSNNYRVEEAVSGQEGLEKAARLRPDTVILDLGLPDEDGLGVLRQLREWSRVPVIVLSVRDRDEDKIALLDAGADDYLTKPFSPRELVARVHAILRRTQGTAVPLVELLSFDDGALEIDTVQHEVRRDGEPVELTPNEYRLLTTLARFPGRTYGRFELIQHVQGYDYEGYERTIDVHVKNLRKKIEPDPKHPRYVETVFGVGYRLAKRLANG